MAISTTAKCREHLTNPQSPNFKSNFRLNLIMSAEIGRETIIYSQLTTKNVSADSPAKTTYDWSNTVM